MALLGKIRSLGPVALISVIGLALFAFVFSTGSGTIVDIFNSEKSTIGVINEDEIDISYFRQKVELRQRQIRGQQSNIQIVNQVWDREVYSKVMQGQFDKLGLSIERDFIIDLLKKSSLFQGSPAIETYEEFADQEGNFDQEKLTNFISNLKAIAPETSILGGIPISYDAWTDFEQQVSFNGMLQSYFSLVRSGTMGTLTEGEFDYNLENDKVEIDLIQIPYSSINDSLVNVSSTEIKDYINRFPKKFEVESSRDFIFVEFSADPSENDKKFILSSLKSLLNDSQNTNSTQSVTATKGFATTSDNESFVNSNSDDYFVDRYVLKSFFNVKYSDSIVSLAQNEVFGPYEDSGFYKLTKMLSVKDSVNKVKVRHILIPYRGAVRADASIIKSQDEAKATADSIYDILKNNSTKFNSLLSLSSDKVSNEKGGVIEFDHANNALAPQFKEFSTQNSKGSLGVVGTDFGFHVIEILDQTFQDSYKVATISKKIVASDETINSQNKKHRNFQISSKNSSFESAAEESDYEINTVTKIGELDENIPGLKPNREIVKWAFDKSTKLNQFKSFKSNNGGHIVVKITSIDNKGLMSTDRASATANPEIVKEKKASLIKSRLPSFKDLESLAKNEDQQIKKSITINMKNPILSEFGKEPLVVGTAFGLKEGEISDPISGQSGVYVLKVNKIIPAKLIESYQASADKVGKAKESDINSKLFEALKDAALIEDNRAFFY